MMTFIRRFCLGILVATAAFAAGSYLAGNVLRYIGAGPAFGVEGGTVRISYGGRGDCSAVVVSPAMAITAAHCVSQTIMTPFGPQLLLVNVPLKLHRGELELPASVLYVSYTRDIAVLAGEFSEIAPANNTLGGSPIGASDEYVSCGHPRSDKRTICVDLGKLVTNDYTLAIFGGILEIGMSGGPVFNKRTGELVGINTNVYGRQAGGGSGVTPIFGLMGELEMAGVLE